MKPSESLIEASGDMSQALLDALKATTAKHMADGKYVDDDPRAVCGTAIVHLIWKLDQVMPGLSGLIVKALHIKN